jgi:hypothetical protein
VPDAGRYRPWGPGCSIWLDILEVKLQPCNSNDWRMPVSKDPSGMNGNRSRDQDGEVRRKRGDTHVGTVEEQYRRDFGVRSDMRLETLPGIAEVPSLTQLLATDLGKDDKRPTRK